MIPTNWRTLTIRTRDNHHVLLPNGTIAKQPIINYSRPTPLQKIHASVSVAYSHPPGEVRASILRAIADADGVCREPVPEVLVRSFGEYAVVYDVRYWITEYARLPQIADTVLARIWYALRRDGLTIPFPTREINLHTLTEDHEARAQQQLRREVFAELRSLAVFKPLTDAQIEQLSRSARLQRYTQGEALVRQGDIAQSLYTVKSGRVRVSVRMESGQVATVATLGQDDFFGEMSLLTGEPRSASVIAETETEVVVVDKADFAAVLESDSGIVESLSMALEERMRNLAQQAGAGPGDAAAPQPPQRAALVQRIRGFFGI